MLIKKNINHARLDDLLALKQKGQMWENHSQRSHFLGYPSNTLNPQNPLSSVLVPDARFAAPLTKMQKEDSEFSFKQRNELNAEMPLDFDDAFVPQLINRYNEYPQQVTKFQRFSSSRKAVEAAKQDSAKVRNKATIGKLINPLKIKEIIQTKAAEPVNHEERADNNIKKPKIMALANCRFYDTLNKIKSLRLSPNNTQIQKQTCITNQRQRYSMAAKEISTGNQSKIASTDTSAEEGYPMRKEIIMSIKKNVDRASLSPNQSQKRRIPQQSEESQTNSMLFYLNQTEQKTRRTPEEPLDSKSKSFIVRSANKRFKKSQRQAQQVTISYKTSILELKELSARYDETMNIRIKIPEIFSNALFDESDDQEQMFLKAASILKELQVHSRQNMTIRKYCNCIIVLVENLAIISYFSGHVYFGGWHQGTKNGLGLQWSPSKFVYYGQYTNGKRQGYGVFKDRKGQVLLGQWKANSYISQH